MLTTWWDQKELEPEPASLTWCEKLTDDGRQVMVKAHIAFVKVS